MKVLRLTADEVRWLDGWVEANVAAEESRPKCQKLGASILQKLRETSSTKQGVNVKPLEEALLGSARGKVVALEGGFAMASRMAANVKATAAQAEIVALWLGRQNWLTEPVTLLTVLKKWNEWLPRARATAPPPALTPGLGTDAVQGRSEAAGAGPRVAAPQPRTRQGGGRALPGLR